MKTLKEIEARLAAIATEMDASGADIDKLTDETKGLIAERSALLENEKRAEELRKLVASGVAGNPITGFMQNAGPESQKKTLTPDSAEYRSAWLRNLQGKDITAEERAALSASGAIPTQTMNQIISRLETYPTLAAISITHIPGNVSFPVEGASGDASWGAVGTASTDSADTITTIALSAYALIKTVEIQANVAAMSIDALEGWLVSDLSLKISKAVDASVYTGNGTNQPTGIITTISTPTGNFTKAACTYKDLMTIISGLATKFLPFASFAMPRLLFYKEVMGMVDTYGKPVVVADPQAPAKFTILGFPVIIDDNITTDNILFGDFSMYKFNFGQDPQIDLDRSVGFRSGSTVYRAFALGDGKLAVPSAFVRYTRAA